MLDMTKSDKPTRKATPAKRTAKRKVQQESTKFKIDGKEVQDFFHYRKNLGATIQTAAQAVGIPRDLLHRWYAEAHERKPVKYATPEQQQTFLYMWESCRALYELSLLQDSKMQSVGDSNGKPQATEFLLKVLDPQRYAIKQQLEVSTDPTVGLKAVIDAAFKKIEPATAPNSAADSESHRKE
jgi:hypothetical protein